MTIEESIEKAIEGGWRFGSGPGQIFQNDELLTLADAKHWFSGIFSSAFLDPSFWQSLGKALGWGNSESAVDSQRAYNVDQAWRRRWHRFIDHLAEGGSAESFFEKLN